MSASLVKYPVRMCTGQRKAGKRSTLNNLALLYKEHARYGEAEPLYRRSLAILLALDFFVFLKLGSMRLPWRVGLGDARGPHPPGAAV